VSANDETQPCTTHPCTKNCGRHIDNRFSFRVCVRCSLDALHEDLERTGYYERQSARIARREEEEAAERLIARGVLVRRAG
jgi:hypothetical protein